MSARGHPLHLLVVEDDLLEARLLKAQLERRAHVHVRVESSAERALSFLDTHAVDAVVTDLVLPGMDGLELLRRIRESDRSLPVAILTAHATVERAVQGLRAGATDYLPKPANVDALLALVDRAVGERPVREEVQRRIAARREGADRRLVGTDPKLDEIRAFAARVAATPGVRVLITGESGTGKNLLANLIHDLSGVPGRFVQINCAGLPGHLLESELFGHERGAFTDAKVLKRGLIESGHNGTVLLDEIGALPLDLQAKLLHFLESGEIRRVGGNTPIPIATRVIAATNEDLHERVRAKEFRLDLLYRLDVTSIEMCPLRATPDVVPELAEHFLREACVAFGRPVPPLDRSSFAALKDVPWPGNARELRNAVERALIFHEDGPLVVHTRPGAGVSDGAGDGVTFPLGLTLEEVERRYLRATLEARPGADLADIAKQLGISRKTLWDRRKRWSP